MIRIVRERISIRWRKPKIENDFHHEILSVRFGESNIFNDSLYLKTQNILSTLSPTFKVTAFDKRVQCRYIYFLYLYGPITSNTKRQIKVFLLLLFHSHLTSCCRFVWTIVKFIITFFSIELVCWKCYFVMGNCMHTYWIAKNRSLCIMLQYNFSFPFSASE